MDWILATAGVVAVGWGIFKYYQGDMVNYRDQLVCDWCGRTQKKRDAFWGREWVSVRFYQSDGMLYDFCSTDCRRAFEQHNTISRTAKRDISHR
jgi:hypothetical protein